MKQLTHGGDWAGYRAEFGRDPLDFSANVSPLGLPEGVAKAITAALATADRYPDPLCRALREKLAVAEGVPAEWLLCGNGAADLIFRLALAAKPRTALVTAPTFAEYATALETAGCTVKRHFLREENDFAVTKDLLNAVHPGTNMVFLCQPNNPTGQAIPLADIRRVVALAAQLSIPVIIDEAYGDYLPREESAIGLTDTFENLVVLRSFSKAHGLAGIRAGYGILPPQLTVPLDNITHPYICSCPARAVAQAALEDEGFLDHTRQVTAQLKAPFLTEQWDTLTLSYTRPETPIFLLTHPDPAVDLKACFDPFHIKVVSGRSFVGLGQNSARLRVPLPQDQEAVLEALRQIDQQLSEKR